MDHGKGTLFTPFRLGPVSMRNRAVRAAAFEGMCRLFREVPFREAYFLEDALNFRSRLKLPLIYVGGLLSYEKINEVLGNGFELVAFARALIKDPYFINKLASNEISHSECDTSNYCIAAMYTHEATCIINISEPDPRILKMLK